MNRFKFRIWDIGLKKFINWDSTLTKDYFNNPNYKVSQWTGLKDMHGADIYEFDILNDINYPPDDWERSIAIYSLELARFVLYFYSPCGGEGWTGEVQHISDFAKNCHVIGNNFQNPELINYEWVR